MVFNPTPKMLETLSKLSVNTEEETVQLAVAAIKGERLQRFKNKEGEDMTEETIIVNEEVLDETIETADVKHKDEDLWKDSEVKVEAIPAVSGEVETPVPVKRKRRTKAEIALEKEQEELEKVKAMAATSGTKDEVFGLDKEYNAVKYAIELNMPVLMIGETGCGKTHLVRSMAHKEGKDLVRLSLNGEVGINEIIGKWLVKDGSTYWQDGVLIDCVRNGKWIVIDEINSALPEVLFAMHSLLDDDKAIVLAEKDGEKVEAHKDFRLFAAMNPPDEYAGTREMNKALLSRFPMVLYIDFYSPRVELDILTYHSGVDIKVGKILIDVASSIRKLKKEQKIWHTCSTRDMINAAKMMVGNTHSLEEVLLWSIINKANKEEWSIIADAIKTAGKIDIDLNWKHDDIEMLTEDLTKDIEELNKQKQELQEIVEEFESRFSGVAAKLGAGK